MRTPDFPMTTTEDYGVTEVEKVRQGQDTLDDKLTRLRERMVLAESRRVDIDSVDTNYSGEKRGCIHKRVIH